MKTYDLFDKCGQLLAFEVDNFYLGRWGVRRAVEGIPGSRILTQRQFFPGFFEEEICEFELHGKRFLVWEPFGDNSRYWIGPDPPEACAEVNLVREAFAAHKPRWFDFLSS